MPLPVRRACDWQGGQVLMAALIYCLSLWEVNNLYTHTGGPYPLPVASWPEMPLFQ